MMSDLRNSQWYLLGLPLLTQLLQQWCSQRKAAGCSDSSGAKLLQEKSGIQAAGVRNWSLSLCSHRRDRFLAAHI